jgi:hypothetical protein
MNFPKAAGEPLKRRSTQFGIVRLDPGIGEAGIDLLVELDEELSGRVLGRADPQPLASS